MEIAAAQPSNSNDVVVDVLAGTVAKKGVPVAVGALERVIVAALAVYRAGLSGERLADAVYHDGSVERSAAGLRVYIHRLRRRVCADFIVSRDRVYALGANVRVIAGELFERPMTAARLQAERAEALENLRLFARKLRAPMTPELQDYDWYVRFAVSRHRIGRELALNVSRELARRNRHLEAIQIATELTFEDPCDEEAWHEVIQSQLALGQRSAALHGFRFLQSVLAKDLGVKPSSAVTALLAL